MNKVIGCVIGTRPEAIKMAPLIYELRKRNFVVKIIGSGQHTDLLMLALRDFDLDLNYQIHIDENKRTLIEMHTFLTEKFSKIFLENAIDLILVHGDTLTAMSAAVAANLSNIKIGHVEAGLRSNNLNEPWPEEINRRIIDLLSDIHFCPTIISLENLKNENLANFYSSVVGNTIVDAFEYITKRYSLVKSIIPDNIGKYVLMTQHRRESFGDQIAKLFTNISQIPLLFDLDIIFPMHPNPNVISASQKYLEGNNRIHIIPPVSYKELVYLLSKCEFVITDSGGIQEEAPLAGKRSLVTRNVTERPEVVDAGYAEIVGADGKSLIDAVERTIESLNQNSTLPKFKSIGIGNSSALICNVIENFFIRTH